MHWIIPRFRRFQKLDKFKLYSHFPRWISISFISIERDASSYNLNFLHIDVSMIMLLTDWILANFNNPTSTIFIANLDYSYFS